MMDETFALAMIAGSAAAIIIACIIVGWITR